MEVTFEQEVLMVEGGGYRAFSNEQKRLFYDRMVETVVYIEVVGPDVDNPRVQKIERGSGVFIDKSGLILSAAHLFFQGHSKINIRRYNDVLIRGAKMVHINPGLDLALILPLVGPTEPPEKYVKFGDAESISIGMDVIGIGHPSDLLFSKCYGQVAYQFSFSRPYDTKHSFYDETKPYRCVGDVLNDDDEILKTYNSDLKVIQVNNFHGTAGISGAPVFNTSGLLIGLCSFIAHGFDFCIHIDVLREFVEENKARPSSGKGEGEGSKKNKKLKDKGKRKLGY